MSSSMLKDFRFATTHEWLHPAGRGVARVGLSEHAQRALGDIVFVELPKAGEKVMAGQEVGVVESVKTASDIYSPVSGDIVAVNERLAREPELVNTSPMDEGWLYAIRMSDPGEADGLLDPDAYEQVCR